MASSYPIFLNLQGLPCVVIGTGRVAERKVRGLLEAGAYVAVIDSQPAPKLVEMESQRLIRIERRAYRPGDLQGMFLAIVASGDPGLNHAIWEEARQRGVPVNVVNDLAHSSFVAPAICRQGNLTVAISTGGKSPALAVRVRDRIAALIGPEHAVLLELLGELREEVTALISDFAARKALWYRLIDSDVIEFVRRNDLLGARQRIAQLLQEARQLSHHPPQAELSDG